MRLPCIPLLQKVPVVVFTNVKRPALCIGKTAYPPQKLISPRRFIFNILCFRHIKIYEVQRYYFYLKVNNYSFTKLTILSSLTRIWNPCLLSFYNASIKQGTDCKSAPAGVSYFIINLSEIIFPVSVEILMT
jgi:hypothetical protein